MQTLRCEECGAVYTLEEAVNREVSEEYDFRHDEWHRFGWHECPCCGALIEEEAELIEPPVDGYDVLIYEEVCEELSREYDKMRL